MPKRTYQPSRRRRSRRLGWRARSASTMVQRRRQKGRQRLTPTAVRAAR
ncbi:50S ribosomal protein L34 [Patescibacteria group bacterium]|nr:50S ribosomal protein L34 [Patescibacteria group bacterium]